jgi:GNAT superfamily N-acetyltransferase
MEITDLPAIDEIQLVAFGAGFVEPMAKFVHILNQYDQAAFVALLEDKIVGYMLAYPSKAEQPDFDTRACQISGDEECVYIHDLCLHPDVHGKGVARQLFSAMHAVALQKGFAQMIGIAVQDSVPFWQKRGFTMLYPQTYNGEPGNYMSLALR